MLKFINKKAFAKEETGAGLVEYALLIALISTISISGVAVFRDKLDDSIKGSAAQITKAGGTLIAGGCTGMSCSGGGGR